MRVLMTNIIALCDEGLYEELLRYVPTERQEKIARCGKRQDRMRSLAAGLLLAIANVFAFQKDGVWSAKHGLFPTSSGARDRDGASGVRHPRKAGAFRRGGGAL